MPVMPSKSTTKTPERDCLELENSVFNTPLIDHHAKMAEASDGFYGVIEIPNDIISNCLLNYKIPSIGNTGDDDVVIIAGVLDTINATSQLKQAQKINDTWGKVKSSLNISCSSLRAIRGAISFSTDSLSFAAQQTTNKTTQIAKVRLQSIGAKLGLIRFAMIIINSLTDMYHSISFSKGLKEAIGPINEEKDLTEKQIKNGLEYLKSKLELTETDKKKILEKCHGNKSVAAKEFIKCKQRKQAQFIRSAGEEVFDKVNQLLSDKKISDIGEKEAKEIFEMIGISSSAILKNQKKSLMKLAICAIGITLIIIGIVGTGGGGLGAVAAVGSIILALIYLVQDIQAIYSLYKQGALDSQDKMLLALTVGLLLFSFVLNLVMPFGSAALIRAGVIEGMWTMLYGYSYIRASRQIKKMELVEATEKSEVELTQLDKSKLSPATL